MRCEECLPLIEEYVDGELEGRTGERVAAHLSACADCEREFAELKREQEVYALYRRDLEVTPADWNIVRARIEQEKDAKGADEPRSGIVAWLISLFGSRNPFRSALVAALVIIVIGVTAVALYINSRGGEGRNDLAARPSATRAPETPREVKESTPGPQPDAVVQDSGAIARNGAQDNTATQPSAPRKVRAAQRQAKAATVTASASRLESGPTRPRPIDGEAQFVAAVAENVNPGTYPTVAEASGDLDFEVTRHAGKAQMLLRSFRNVRPQSTAGATDVSYEREQSRRLLYQNIALRREASAHGDQSSAQLLDTLEPILLDIANLPARARSRDLRPIERRMEKKEIVAALQVRTLLASN